jgi:hypothetical protein
MSISVLELTADGAVARGDCHTTSKDTTCLHDNSRSDPGESTIYESGRATAAELVRLGINILVASQHADVWNLDLVEQKETIIHGVVTKLRANISNVDVL